MTLTELQYIVALAQERHFGRAAEACFATQSTLSAGLQELENLLDVKLVERSKRRVMLTRRDFTRQVKKFIQRGAGAEAS